MQPILTRHISTSYTERINSLQGINQLLIRSNEEEQQHFTHYRERLMQNAEIVPLTAEILIVATTIALLQATYIFRNCSSPANSGA
jgi:hypothetical protein